MGVSSLVLKLTRLAAGNLFSFPEGGATGQVCGFSLGHPGLFLREHATYRILAAVLESTHKALASEFGRVWVSHLACLGCPWATGQVLRFSQRLWDGILLNS